VPPLLHVGSVVPGHKSLSRSRGETIGGDVRVDGQGVFDRLVNIEVEMRQEIDLVDDHDAACAEHVRIFERLVFAFSHRKDGDLRLLRPGRTELDRPDCRRRLTQNPLRHLEIDALDIPLQVGFTHAAYTVPFCGLPRCRIKQRALRDGPWRRSVKNMTAVFSAPATE
jgi:hypothetical protein